jgi:hypothetical protein
MAIIKITITERDQQSAYIKWLQEKPAQFSTESQPSHRAANGINWISSTVYCTIPDELVALEFMLAFDGTVVSEEDHKQHLTINHVGWLISR